MRRGSARSRESVARAQRSSLGGSDQADQEIDIQDGQQCQGQAEVLVQHKEKLQPVCPEDGVHAEDHGEAGRNRQDGKEPETQLASQTRMGKGIFHLTAAQAAEGLPILPRQPALVSPGQNSEGDAGNEDRRRPT